jgi:peptide deformylase
MNILQWPDPILAQVADEVLEVTDGVRSIASAMLATMREHRGVGLAAPQIGVPLRLIVGEGPGWTFALVNPVVAKASEQMTALNENCLSFKGAEPVRVYRPKQVVISGLNLRGEPMKFKARGLIAAVLQHEIDHLNGVTLHHHKGMGNEPT